MNSRCKNFREMIEKSVSEELSGEERSMLDEHLEGCDGCRQYLEALNNDDSLLRGYAGLFKDSVLEVRRTAAAEDKSAQSDKWWRNIFMSQKFALAATAVILLAAAMYFTVFETSTPAFARVLDKIAKATDVTYTEIMEIEGLESSVSKTYVNNEGVIRSEGPNGTIMLFDFNGGTQMTLYSGTKKAFIYKTRRRENASDFNLLVWMSELYKESYDRRGTDFVDGMKTDLYVSDNNTYSIRRVWTDPEIGLPIKIVHISTPHPDTTIITPILFLKKSSFGIDSDVTYGAGGQSNTGVTRKATTTKKDFIWNSGLDESLFSLTPPEGFSVEIDSLIELTDSKSDVLRALEQWTSISDGRFPDDINDLSNQKLAEPLLVKAFHRDGDPEEEFDQAMRALQTILNGCFFAQLKKAEGAWNYSGKGVRLGDEESPVCWWKEEKADKYTIIYGDLRIDEVPEKDLPQQ